MACKQQIKKAKTLRDKYQDLTGAKKILENLKSKAKLPKEKLEIIQSLAHIYLDLGKIQKADIEFQKGIALARKINNEKMLADLLRKYGYFANKYHKNGGKEGLKHIAESLAICDKNKNNIDFQKIKASALAAKGNIFFDSGKSPAQTFKIYQEGLKICDKIGFLERKTTILGDIANIYIWKLKNFRKAKALLMETMQIAANNYKHALPSSAARLGYLALLQKKFDEARMWAEISLIASQHGGWKREEAEVLELLGDIYKQKSEVKKAREKFKQSLKIYKRLNYHSRIKKIKKKLKP